jgi:hypothetical protein
MSAANTSLQALVAGCLRSAKAAQDLAVSLETQGLKVSGPDALRMLARSLEASVAGLDPQQLPARDAS